MTLKELIKTIDRKEKFFLLILIIVIVIVTSIPYLYGYFNRPADSYYTGKHTLSSIDLYLYLSYFEQVKQGHFFFINLYTSEPQFRNIILIFSFLPLVILVRFLIFLIF